MYNVIIHDVSCEQASCLTEPLYSLGETTDKDLSIINQKVDNINVEYK